MPLTAESETLSTILMEAQTTEDGARAPMFVLSSESTDSEWQEAVADLSMDGTIFNFVYELEHHLDPAALTFSAEGALEDGSSVFSGASAGASEEELRRVQLLKEQNAAMLARMSKLMAGIREKKDEVEDNGEEEEVVEAPRVERLPREDYGLDLKRMKQWVDARNDSLMKQEEYLQEMAVSRVRGFLDAVRMVTRLQTWFRMMKFRKEFSAFRKKRLAVKDIFFVAWKRMWKSEKLFMWQIIGKPFEAWATEASESKRLRVLVKDFFALCISRLKLTPQAVMIFFAEKESGREGEESIMSLPDELKFRRLILSKLFGSWRTETRELRGQRFRACQTLTRVMRKIKGPLWVKEGLLVCFHIWFRYTSVRSAYKRNEPDPVFKNPHLPQWAKLYQSVMMKRMHHKVAQDKGSMMLIIRNFRNWKTAMTIDRSKFMTPLAIAINHHTMKVYDKIFGGWGGYMRERGQISRIRDRCFASWKKWAPRKRRLKAAKKAVNQLSKFKAVVRSYKIMTAQCFQIIVRRAATLRLVRDNFQNRKLVVCAYALLNRESHVIMLDCWRRWCLWSKNRRRWAKTLWQYRYLYYDAKMRAIVSAWRDFARQQREARGGGVSGVMMVHVSTNGSRSGSPLPDSSPQLVARKSLQNKGKASLRKGEEEEKGEEEYDSWTKRAQHDCARLLRLAQLDSFTQRPNEQAFLLFCRAILLFRRTRGAASAADTEDEGEWADDLGSMASSAAGDSVSKLGNSVGSRSVRSEQAGSRKSGGSKAALTTTSAAAAAAAVSTNASVTLGDDNLGGVEDQEGKDEESEEDDETAGENLFDEPSVSSVSANKSLTESLKILLSMGGGGKPSPDLAEELQDKLQRGVDLMDMRIIALAVEEGARIDTAHVRQVANHIGDFSVPVFLQLLSGSLEYVVERVLSNDRISAVLQCAHPINALLINEHLARWESHDITSREMSALTKDAVLSEAVGSVFSGVMLWRTVVVLTLKRKEELMRHASKILPVGCSMDQEVRETVKRNALKKTLATRRNMTRLMGVDGGSRDEQDKPGNKNVRYDLDDYPEPPPIVGEAPKPAEPDNSWARGKNIEQLLHEFITLMNSLMGESLALRQPQLQRDDKLLFNGIMNQSRKDFLVLRDMTRSPAERKLIRDKAKDKAQKAAQKAAKERRKTEKMFEKEYYRSKKEDADEPEEKDGSQVLDGEGLDGAEEGDGEGEGDDQALAEDDDDEAEKPSKGKKGKGKAKRSKKNKVKKPAVVEETDEMREAFEKLDDKDEYHDLLQPFDPIACSEQDLFLSSLLAPQEFADQEVENLFFESRKAVYPTFLFETWRPRGKSKTQREVLICLAARACKEAMRVPRRALALLRAAGEYATQLNSNTFVGGASNSFGGGFGGWIIAQVVDKSSSFCTNGDRELWPEEYWDLFQLEAKIKLGKMLLSTTLSGLVGSIESEMTLAEQYTEQKKELEEYLLEHRAGLVDIGKRRREKLGTDGEVNRDNEKIKAKHLATIAAHEADKLKIQKVIQSTDVLFASGNFQQIINMLGDESEYSDEPPPPPAEGEELERSPLQLRARYLVQRQIECIAAVDASIAEVRERIEAVDRDIHSFERYCNRADRWLRNLAESHFLMMVDAQQIVQRLVTDKYQSSRRTGSLFPWIAVYKRKFKESKAVLSFVVSEKAKYLAELEAAEAEDRRIRNLAPGERERALSRQKAQRGGKLAEEGSTLTSGEHKDGELDLSLLLKSKMKGLYDGEITLDDTAIFEANLEVGHEGLEPRKLTLEEEEMILCGTTQAEIEERKLREELEARLAAEAAERERQRIIQEKLAMDEMQRLLEIEQEAMLIMHQQRAKLFDEYWDLIVPIKIDPSSRAASRGADAGANSPMPSRPGTAPTALQSQAAQAKARSLKLDDTDEEFGRTRRQWVAIGDENWKTKRGLSTRQKLVEMAAQEGGPLPEQLSLASPDMTETSSAFFDGGILDLPPLPSDLDVGAQAWMAHEGLQSSIYMGKENQDLLMAQLVDLSDAHSKALGTDEDATASQAPFQPIEPEESGISSPSEVFAGSRRGTMTIARPSEDQYSAVGKRQIASFIASVERLERGQEGWAPRTTSPSAFDHTPQAQSPETSVEPSRAASPETVDSQDQGLEENPGEAEAAAAEEEEARLRANMLRDALLAQEEAEANSPRPVEVSPRTLNERRFSYMSGHSSRSSRSQHFENMVRQYGVRFADYPGTDHDTDYEDVDGVVYPEDPEYDTNEWEQRRHVRGWHNDMVDEDGVPIVRAPPKQRYDYNSIDVGRLGLESAVVPPPKTTDAELESAYNALRQAEYASQIPIPKPGAKRVKHAHKTLTATLSAKPRPTRNIQALFLSGRAPEVPSAFTRFRSEGGGSDQDTFSDLRVGDSGMEEGSVLDLASGSVALSRLSGTLGLAAVTATAESSYATLPSAGQLTTQGSHGSLKFSASDSLRGLGVLAGGSRSRAERLSVQFSDELPEPAIATELFALADARAPSPQSVGAAERTFAGLLALVHAEMSEEGPVNFQLSSELKEQVAKHLLGRRSTRGIMRGGKAKAIDAQLQAQEESLTAQIQLHQQQRAASPTSLASSSASQLSVGAGGDGLPNRINAIKVLRRDNSQGSLRDAASSSVDSSVARQHALGPTLARVQSMHAPDYSAASPSKSLRPLTPQTLALLGERVREALLERAAHENGLEAPAFTHLPKGDVARRLQASFLQRKDNYQHFSHHAAESTLFLDGRPLDLGVNPSLTASQSLTSAGENWPRSTSQLSLSPVSSPKRQGAGMFDVRKQQRPPTHNPDEVVAGGELLDFDAAFAHLRLKSGTPLGLGSLTAPGSAKRPRKQKQQQGKQQTTRTESDGALLATAAAKGEHLASSLSAPQLRAHEQEQDLPVQGRALVPAPVSQIKAQAAASASAPGSPVYEAVKAQARSAADQAYLRDLEDVYARLLDDDDGSLEAAYVAALGLLPQPSYPLEQEPSIMNDDLEEDEEEEEEEEDEEENEEEQRGGLVGETSLSLSSAALQARAPLEDEEFVPGTSALRSPSALPGRGLSMMRVASPLPQSPLGRLRPRAVAGPAGAEGLVAQLDQRRQRRRDSPSPPRRARAAESAEAAAEAEAPADEEKEWREEQEHMQQSKTRAASAEAALRLLHDTALHKFLAPPHLSVVVAAQAEAAAAVAAGAGEGEEKAGAQAAGPLYTSEALAVPALLQHRFMLDAPPPPASGALLISTLNSLALTGSSANKGAQPGAATRQPHLTSKAAEEAALRSLSNSHSHSLISSSNASGDGGGGTSKTFTSRHFLQADANGEPDLLTQQQQQQQAWRGPNTLGEDDEADLDLALRTMLGGGRGSKALGGMMRSSAAAAGDSAAALFAAEMAGGRGAKARGRSKQPRLGGGKLLPPLQNAGPSVEKIAADLDNPVGLLEVLSGSVKRKGVVHSLISKGLEGGGGGRRVAPILSRSLDSLGASAARPKSKE